ncbi:hypothetical protein VB712_19910 [Spirulina sp. CCNP1310]|uniref:hypothetical protein n=1 Tax=Spirulina sp. CCNP1310 TaxID=3110249 RepID=UPI002B21693E|nr:hypothetical protein [Spirulina sp. CCNP1310]MEA5421494.1 hypothetical protein [Spirulina sp. CCNP1310]
MQNFEFFQEIHNDSGSKLSSLNLDEDINLWLRYLAHEKQKKQIHGYIESFIYDNRVIGSFLGFYKILLKVTHQKIFSRNLAVKINNLIPFVSFDERVDNIENREFSGVVTDVRKEIVNTDTKMPEDDMNNINGIVLIAFILAAVGVAIYILNSKKNDEESDRNFFSEQASISPPPKTYGQYEHLAAKTIVFLAVNADRAEEEEIIGDLKHYGVSQKFVDFTKRTSCIKTLWQGPSNQYTQQKIKNCFDERQKATTNESNDIYLIEIELDSSRPEFEDGNLSARWYRGFRAIAEGVDVKIKNIQVSKRMRKEAVNNPSLKIPS